MVTDVVPMGIEDLADYFGLDHDVTTKYMALFVELKSLTLSDGVYEVTNYQVHQAKPDNSTARVQKFRDQKKQAQQEQPSEPETPTETPCNACNGSETRFSNDCNAPKNLDIEKEGRLLSPSRCTNAVEEVPGPNGHGRDEDAPETLLAQLFGGHDPPNPAWADLVSLQRLYGREEVARYLRSALARNITGSRALPYVETCIKNARKEAQANAVGSSTIDPNVGL